MDHLAAQLLYNREIAEEASDRTKQNNIYGLTKGYPEDTIASTKQESVGAGIAKFEAEQLIAECSFTPTLRGLVVC